VSTQDENQQSLAGGLGSTEPVPATEAADAAEEAAAAVAEPEAPVAPEVDYVHGPAAQKFGWWWGTGRRKTAVARVRLRPGSGEFRINGRDIDTHFSEMRDRNDVVAPLEATSLRGSLDIHVNVRGGGITGQAGAILLGVARALRVYDATLEPILREHGYLTRDAREVERKKYGLAGARRRFQFSKR